MSSTPANPSGETAREVATHDLTTLPEPIRQQFLTDARNCADSAACRVGVAPRYYCSFGPADYCGHIASEYLRLTDPRYSPERVALLEAAVSELGLVAPDEYSGRGFKYPASDALADYDRTHGIGGGE